MTAISLEERKKFIGASEVAALFGESTFTTAFELWHRKAGNLPETDLSDNERVFWGNQLESAIALGLAQQEGWRVRKVNKYITHPSVQGMGASLDYEIIDHPNGPGALEIKTVDWLIFKDWPDGEPPLSYMLQLQHQLAVTGRSWGAVGVLVGGNDPKVYTFQRHQKTIDLIEARIDAFWASIREGREPKPDWEQDSFAVCALYSTAQKAKVIDLSQDNRLPILCEEYQKAALDEKEAAARKAAAKAEIVAKIDDAEKAFCGDFTISAGMTKETPATVITDEMIGLTYGGRRSFRQFRLTQKKKQQQKEAA